LIFGSMGVGHRVIPFIESPSCNSQIKIHVL
jgi:hypothetical protein